MLRDAKISLGADGRWSAGAVVHPSSSSAIGLTVDKGGRVWKRRAMRPFAPGGATFRDWLVAELGDVRVYCMETAHGLSMVVTREDLYPDFTDAAPTPTD